MEILITYDANTKREELDTMGDIFLVLLTKINPWETFRLSQTIR